MKNFYTILFAVILGSSHAQTLTQSANEPIVGDVDKNYDLDTSMFTSGLPITITGSTCVWNFKDLLGAFPLTVDSFVSPLATPGTTAYPGATYVQHRATLYTYFKSTPNPQQTELLGAYSPSLSLTFTNSAVIATYPVNYGYNITDAVSGTFKYNATNGACNGNIVIKADGLGAINLPNGVSFQNVLRLKSVETITLSSGIVQFGTFNQTIYNYYKPGQKFPVLSLQYQKYQLIAGTPTITAGIYGSNSYFTVAGINDHSSVEQEVQVYPNPFSDALFLRSPEANEEADYGFSDVNGKIILRTTSLDDPQIRTMAPGVYFLEIKSKNGTSHQKIIKQ